MTKRPKLVAIDYSPWSLKAAWALHLRGIDHRVEHYTPTLGEPGLRLRLGRVRGRVSVPVLFGTDEGTIEDSWEIARWAAQHGSGVELFPDVDEVRRWNELSERALEIGRRRSVTELIGDAEALDEASSKVYPAFVAPALRPVARAIARRTMGKYDADEPQRFVEVLDQLREGLSTNAHLIGAAPSYADVVMAVVLEYVSPGSFVKRGPAELRNWSQPDLIERYGDLLEWRDALVAETGFTGLR
jgi:glutathione S-transferase